MFKEEESGTKRVNEERTEQLLQALDHTFGGNGSNVVSTACPFCMRMLTDGLSDKQREDIEQSDIAELLCRSVLEME